MGRRRRAPSKGWWTSIPAFVKELAGLLTAVAAVLGGLTAAGVIGGGDRRDREVPSTAVAEAPSAAMPIVVRFEGKDKDYSERGFFTPRGYIVSTQYALASAMRVAWTAEGRTQEARVRKIEEGAHDARGAVLFEVVGEDAPRAQFSIRNAQSLSGGEPVSAQLGSSQSTPGTILKIAASVEVEGYGTLPNLVVTTSLGRESEGGAPLLDGKLRVIGMLFATGGDQTVSIPIEDIRAEFPNAF